MSEHASFFRWNVTLDSVATTAAHASVSALDPNCCSACATLIYAIQERALPAEIETFLRLAGVDLRKASLVSGIPEEGFLDGCWIIIGQLHGGEWDGEAKTAFEEPLLGFKCWLTSAAMVPSAAFEGKELFQLEFEWRGSSVQGLQRKATAV